LDTSNKDLVSSIVAEIDVSGEEPTTTSLQVAIRFKKQHKDVLRSIRNLECSEAFRRRNFALSSYINEQGKEQPCYHMTKDGFTFAVMSFTGNEAGQWKEAYIEAFNRMADTIRRFVSFGVPGELYAQALEAEKKEAVSFGIASVAGRTLSLRRKEKKAFQGIVAMVREEVQLSLLLGRMESPKALNGE
jgi:Rha family phage regulatory protein